MFIANSYCWRQKIQFMLLWFYIDGLIAHSYLKHPVCISLSLHMFAFPLLVQKSTSASWNCCLHAFLLCPLSLPFLKPSVLVHGAQVQIHNCVCMLPLALLHFILSYKKRKNLIETHGGMFDYVGELQENVTIIYKNTCSSVTN